MIAPWHWLQEFFRGDFRLILPEVELLLFGLGILIIDLWEDAKSRFLNALLALMGVGFSGYTLWVLYTEASRFGEQEGFHHTIVVDQFFLFFGMVFLVATALVVLLSTRYMRIEEEDHGEYYALMLFATVGMMFMASGIDLVVQFLGLETMAISFYILTGFLRRERRSNEAALKYLLLGAFSSGILAYGFSLLYGLGRSTNIRAIAQALLARQDALRLAGAVDWLLMAAFVTVGAGLFFKVAAVPFHQWAPDVYEGAPTTITAYLSVASMTASFALLLRLFLRVFVPSHAVWAMLVAVVAVASMTVGNFAALTQRNVKRLLAYSSIAHVGYLLLGLVALNVMGLVGIMYYLFAYAFMTIGAFAVVIVLRRKGLIGDELEDLDGLYQRSPAAAALMLIFMLSLAGIPPTAGFMGKYFIFQALMMSKHYTLAVLGALYIVPGLYYYFRIVVHAWIREPGARTRPAVSMAQAVALTVAVFITLAAGIYPQPFTQLALYAIGR
jgi:NADH-quinone oxidoreductase subunit N